MGSAADELFKKFDEHVRGVDRKVKEDDEHDRRVREHFRRESGTAFERLKNIMHGEKPTRETNEEYRKRKEGEAAKELKRRPPKSHPIAVRG